MSGEQVQIFLQQGGPLLISEVGGVGGDILEQGFLAFIKQTARHLESFKMTTILHQRHGSIGEGFTALRGGFGPDYRRLHGDFVIAQEARNHGGALGNLRVAGFLGLLGVVAQCYIKLLAAAGDLGGEQGVEGFAGKRTLGSLGRIRSIWRSRRRSLNSGGCRWFGSLVGGGLQGATADEPATQQAGGNKLRTYFHASDKSGIRGLRRGQSS